MDPEYFSASPTVMAYDYATGGYFAPNTYGQQTVAQAEAAAVRAAEPVISYVPATAPLVAHPTPNYPRQGHVPTFTMPMNKGEWNIRGIDIPTYSPALPPMPGSDWRTFPQPIDGAQLTWMRPQFSAFAGAGHYGMVDYNRPGVGKSREVQGAGGYRYKQFADGAVLVMISPDPNRLLPGTILTGNDPRSPTYTQWVSITNEIGNWTDFAKKRQTDVFKAIVDSTVGGSKKRRGKGKKGKRGGAPSGGRKVVPVEDSGEEDEKEESDFFSGPLPWVIGGGLALVAVIVLASGGQK